VVRSTLSVRRLLNLLPSTVSPDDLERLLFDSKAEIERREGDQMDLSVTPDRLDLLTEGGLGLYLAGALEVATGLPRIRSARAVGGGWAFRVDASVDPLRPFIAGAVVRAPPRSSLDDGLLEEAVRFQELLHATVGRDRRAMSLGIYPADRIEPPVRYSLLPAGAVRFVPLHATEEIPADRFLDQDPMGEKYGPLGRSGDRCLVLIDSHESVLSLPPVINSRSAGEARTGDRELLLEATGTRARSVEQGLGLLLVVFASRGWSVAPVSIEKPGNLTNDGRAPISPRTLELPRSNLSAILGKNLSAAEVRRQLGRARLGSRSMPGGWRVEAPPWRPDLLTGVDVAEEVVLSAGVRAEDGIVPPSPTRGRRRRESEFRRRMARRLLGLGLAEPHTPLLVSEGSVARVAGNAPIRLLHPVSAEFAYVRDRLLLSHLDVLAHNTRHGYPQRFGEIGPVVVRAPAAETGSETRYHAGVLLAGEGAGFADAAAVVEYLLRDLDVSSVREPAELPGTIPGRGSRVRVAGEVAAELGEVDPRILEEIGVPVPAAWAEVDLTVLWPLLRRGVTN
jgi:phenylalanyl-tRNA synthetase beta chain